MISNIVLSSLYYPSHLDVPRHQDETSLTTFIELLTELVDYVEKHKEKLPWSEHERELFQRSVNFLKDSRSGDQFDLFKARVRWFPDYGCALMTHEPKFSVGVTHIRMIVLDEWSVYFHSMANKHQQTSICNGYKILPFGHVIDDQKELFLYSFGRFLKDKSECKSQKPNRTPSFIASAVLKTFKEVYPNRVYGDEVLANGSTTDVGRHTGREPQDTVWPLLRSVLSQCMNDMKEAMKNTHYLFDKMLLSLHTMMLNQYLRYLKINHRKESFGLKIQIYIDILMRIMETISLKLQNLTEEGFDTSFYRKNCFHTRRCLETIVKDFSEERDSKYELKRMSLADVNNLTFPVLSSNTFHNIASSLQPTLEGLRIKARKNADFHPALDEKTLLSSDLSFTYIDKWLKHYKESKEINHHIYICEIVEKVFLHYSKSLLEDHVLPLDEIEKMEIVLDFYRGSRDLLYKNSKQQDLLMVMLYSRETLVVWIAYCLSFKSIKCHIAESEDLNVVLNYNDMKHLVINDKSCNNAIFNVAEYLNNNAGEKKLFSLNESHNRVNMDFAERFARNNGLITDVLKKIRQSDQEKIRNHRQHIEQKKEEARSLKNKICDLESEKSRVHYLLNCSWYQWTEKRLKEAEYRDICYRLEKLEQEKTTVEKAPDPLILPLPEDDSSAYKVLFYLYIPKPLEVLSRLSVSSQMMFLPRRNHNPYSVKHGIDYYQNYEKVKKAAVVRIGQYIDWGNHFNKYLIGSNLNPISTKSMKLISRDNITVPDCTSFPRHIDSYSTGLESVWYPSSFDKHLAWNGGCMYLEKLYDDAIFDPFNVPSDFISVVYTEPLPEDYEQLQDAMILNGKDRKERSNLGIAQQHLRSNEMSKEEYLAFWSLRSYPNLQVRNLCSGIKESVFTLKNPAVCTILRQSLFQLGPFDLPRSESIDANRKWFQDFICKDRNGKDSYHNFCGILDETLKKLSDCPREYENVPLLTDLVTYLADWDRCGYRLDRDLFEILTKWAEDIPISCSKGQMMADKVLNNKARRCLLYGYAILCFNLGHIDKDYASKLLKTIVRFQHCRYEIINYHDLHKRFEKVENMIYQVLARRVNDITASLSDIMISAAFRLIYEDAPCDLHWSMDSSQGFSTCYEAIDSKGTLYTINVLNGIVLCNGLPPGYLPNEVIKHSTYQRFFGEMNFEVKSLQLTHWETIKSFNGYYYSFMIGDDGKDLRVTQRTMDKSPTLILMSNYKVGSIPERLKELYSHWCVENLPHEDIILFRDVNFRENKVYFIYIGTSTGHEEKCIEVPTEYQQLPYLELLNHEYLNTWRIIKTPCKSTLEVLSKFENEIFIHSYVSPSDDKKLLEISMPRFNMSFMFDDFSLVSNDLRGYKLAEKQQRSELFSFLCFETYLVFERMSSDPTNPKLKVFIPDGEVVIGNNKIFVKLSCDYNAAIRFHIYDWNEKLKRLKTNSIESRIFLAVIYAATGTMLPNPITCMTGSEAALEELYNCRVNRPLTDTEQRKLDNISIYCHREPALKLRKFCLESLSEKLHVLFHSSEKVQSYDPSAASEYIQLLNSPRKFNFRRLLTSMEESMCSVDHTDTSPNKTPTTSIEGCTIGRDFVDNVDDTLLKDYVLIKQNLSDSAYCLGNTSSICDTVLGKEMIDDIKNSHESYLKERLYEVDQSKMKNLRDFVQEKLSESQRYIEEISRFIFETLNQHDINISSKDCRSDESIAWLCNMQPTVSFNDYMKMAWDTSQIQKFNPNLTDDSCLTLQNAILNLMKIYCVQDKLLRIAHSIENETVTSKLITELQCKREYDYREFPKWLIFEVENGIQIRPIQAKVALFLIKAENKGSLVQLNMGLGKTRVILPLLILYFTSAPKSNEFNKLCRVNFLRQLADEAYDYLHKYLTDSVFSMMFFEIPFNRSMSVTPIVLREIAATLDLARSHNYCVISTPESRLSFKLKRYEDNTLEETFKNISECIDDSSFLDIYDESDELLHHRFELSYTIGHHLSLPNGTERWETAFTILKILNDLFESSEHLPKEAILWEARQTVTGAFKGLRLIDRKVTKKNKIDMINKVMNKLFTNPPYEFGWVKKYADAVSKRKIIDAVTNNMRDITELIERDDYKSVEYQYINSLRGFLGHDIMFHCLGKRHRVDYGLDPRRKNHHLAVPFHGVDEPSLRADYAHPDVSICFTILSFYYDGLNVEQLAMTFNKLLSLDYSIRQHHYRSWYRSIGKDLNDESRFLDDTSKLDTTNNNQMNQLFQMYHKNMKVINFYLTYHVFPVETCIFPKQMNLSSWSLASTRDSVGFSGTKDNHPLMPITLKLADTNIDTLNSTDGMMLQNLLMHAKCEYCGSTEKIKAWKYLLKFVLRENISALIDTGGLLTGVTNAEGAKYLTRKLLKLQMASNRKGVVYFDTEKMKWMVIVKDSSFRQTPLKQSPINPSDCIVIFDEPRCRGSDFKLHQNAVAVLTLGRNLTKDKLVQGAGRMREFGKGQTIRILYFQEIKASIMDTLSCKDISLQNILKWVLSNSIESCKEGLTTWGMQGLHHCAVEENRENIYQSSNFDILSMFGPKVALYNPKDIVYRKIDGFKFKCCSTNPNHMLIMERIERIHSKLNKYGSDFKRVAQSFNAECERELEYEIEEEEEKEIELPLQKAYIEVDWDYKKILRIKCPSELGQSIVTSLSSFLIGDLNGINGIDDILFHPGIFCTNNYRRTIRETIHASLEHYLRPIQHILMYKDNKMLYLSDREADSILPLIQSQSYTGNADFVTLTLAEKQSEKHKYGSFVLGRKEALVSSAIDVVLGPWVQSKSSAIDSVLGCWVQSKLLNGVTNFDCENEKKLMEMMIKKGDAAGALKTLLIARGYGSKISRSDFEEFVRNKL